MTIKLMVALIIILSELVPCLPNGEKHSGEMWGIGGSTPKLRDKTPIPMYK